MQGIVSRGQFRKKKRKNIFLFPSLNGESEKEEGNKYIFNWLIGGTVQMYLHVIHMLISISA